MDLIAKYTKITFGESNYKFRKIRLEICNGVEIRFFKTLGNHVEDGGDEVLELLKFDKLWNNSFLDHGFLVFEQNIGHSGQKTYLFTLI